LKKEESYVLTAFILAIVMVTFVPTVFKSSLPFHRQEGILTDNSYPESLGGKESMFLITYSLMGQVSVVFLPALSVGALTYFVIKIHEKKTD